MSHYFIADTHFGHTGIHEKFRNRFNSQSEHDDFIHGNIIECGGSNNVLWMLGDTFLKASEYHRLDDYAKRYQKVNIVLGNHCKPSLARYALSFKNVDVFGVVQKFGCVLTHIPIPVFELDRGFCIHGHLHDKSVSENGISKGFQVEHAGYFCVSCENIGYKPISLGAIKAIKGW